ncbi:hypothetical protein ABGB19_20835 [Mycobacterium sp. B14F4]|uniref:hypothetical protein n=1 Tax=Mycobacterium sp. B14F4 TaxID=3153565 RepID=UPI00325D0240
MAFVGVGLVVSAFVVDGSLPVLGAGLFAARHFQASDGVVGQFDGVIDDDRCGGPAQGREQESAARMGGVSLPVW